MKKPKFEIARKERETNQALIRRFTKRLRDSGILINANKSQFKKRPKSLQMRKKAVVRKIETRAIYEKKQKLGQI